MGLIQDLHGRKLTGCRGCDAVRKTLYRGLDLWKPGIHAASSHDSFNASKLGAFSRSALGARGGGGQVFDPAFVDWFHLRIVEQYVTPTVDVWSVTVYVHNHPHISGWTPPLVTHGDANIYVSGALYAYGDWSTRNTVGAGTASWLGSGCADQDVPVGYERWIWSRSDSSQPPRTDDISDNLERVDITNSSGDVVDTYQPLTVCSRHDTGVEWVYEINKVIEAPVMEADTVGFGYSIGVNNPRSMFNAVVFRANGEWPTSNQWSVVSTPDGGGGTWNDDTLLETAEYTPDTVGSYTLGLTGTNSAGVSEVSEVILTVI